MRRFFASLTVLALIIPLSASALTYRTPGALLQAIDQQEKPQVFDMEFHAFDDGDYFSFWIKGATEGVRKDWMKTKARMTLHAVVDGEFGEIKGEMMMFQHTVYMRVSEANLPESANADLGEFASMLGQWYKISLPPEIFSSDFETQQLADLWAMTNTDMSAEEFQREVWNTIFAMTRNQFDGGHAYSLKLNPNMLSSLGQLYQSFDGNVDFTMEDMGDMLDIQAEIDNMVNVHIKIDTDPEGEMMYSKFYVSITPPDDNMHFVMLGSSTTSYDTVYLEIPGDAIDLTEESGINELFNMSGYIQDLDDGNLWDEDDWTEAEWDNSPLNTDDWERLDWDDEEWDSEEWDSDDWDDDDWDDEDWSDWDDEEWDDSDNSFFDSHSNVERPMFDRADGTTMHPFDASRAGAPQVHTYPRCDAEPGTSRYAFLQRRGVCPVVRFSNRDD